MDLDLNHRRTIRAAFSAALIERVDAALEAQPEAQRRYIGASAIGDVCARRVQLNVWETFHPNAQIKRAPWPARTKRIFERGHLTETAVADWLCGAGIEISRYAAPGQQHGFTACDGRIAGHADGIVRSGLIDATPCLWEHKTLGAKGWRAVQKDGVVKTSPQYADQIALLQHHLNLTEHPALFTALNADTMELLFELVAFDAARCQAAIDRAVWILQAIEAGEFLPRAAATDEAYPCSGCRYRGECW